MRVALNLLGYTPGRGGVDTYLSNLLQGLQKVDEANEYLVLCDPLAAGRFESLRTNFSLRQIAIERPGRFWLLRGTMQNVFAYDLLKWVLRDLDVDVVHHPLTTLNPPGLRPPAVLTFHDMQHEFYPELFAARELARRHRQYRASVHEAQVVIAISQHVKESLVQRYSVPPEKVCVVHHGIAERFRKIDDQDRLTAVRRKYALDRPFIIYPAATWAHKNHLRLLGAIRSLVRDRRFDGELVLVGIPMDFHGQVMKEAASSELRGRVRWLGFVPEEDLPCLYNLARMMVFPSLFEGFGLPVVEAMACGCPVALANATALPEIAGDAALRFDPCSEEALADCLDQLWADHARCHELSRAGRERASLFTWEKAARETLAAYHRAAR